MRGIGFVFVDLAAVFAGTATVELTGLEGVMGGERARRDVAAAALGEPCAL